MSASVTPMAAASMLVAIAKKRRPETVRLVVRRDDKRFSSFGATGRRLHDVYPPMRSKRKNETRWIPIGDPVIGEIAEQPSNRERQRLEKSEHQSDARRIASPGFWQLRALAQGCRTIPSDLADAGLGAIIALHQ